MTLKTPKHVVELIDLTISVTDLNDMSSVSEEKVIAIITQDRQAIATALLTALEGNKKDCGNYKFVNGVCRVCDYTTPMRTAHNQALDQAITIVKGLLTPTNT